MLHVLLPLHLSIANISNPFQNRLGNIPLLQAWAYRHHFGGSLTLLEEFFETIKAANTGIKQLNFINMPIYILK